jgi:predicted acetyltransferase
MDQSDLRILDVTSGDASGLDRVWSVVFDRGDPAPYRVPLLRPGERGYLAMRGGRVAGGYSVLRLELTRGAASLPCGGIARVAVTPEHRQGGVGYAMMARSLGEMRRNGQVLAALYAFRDSYYRKFGYEVTGRRWLIRCPQHRLPAFLQTLPARQIDPAEVMALDAAYRTLARSMNGAHIRNEADWRERLGQKPPMICAVGDPVEGYAWTTMEGGFWEDLRVGEVAWSTPQGYASIMAVLAGLCVNRSALVWHEPSRSPFLAAHVDQGVSFALDRLAQFRCLDVPGALERLAPEASGEFTLAVTDVLVPENAGPWRVRFGPGKVEVGPSSSAEIAMDIRAFSQALMGEPSLHDLLALGLATSGTDAGARAACALLPASPVTLMEFF